MRDLLNAVRAVLLVFWPISAMAAAQSLGSTFTSITLSDWVSLIVLTIVSSLVALLHRVRQSFEAEANKRAGRPSQEEDVQLIDWRWFAACHVAGGMFVGFISFAFCEGMPFEINSYIEAAVIALSSWRGAKLADRWADSVTGNFTDRLGAVFGKKEAP